MDALSIIYYYYCYNYYNIIVVFQGGNSYRIYFIFLSCWIQINGRKIKFSNIQLLLNVAQSDNVLIF